MSPKRLASSRPMLGIALAAMFVASSAEAQLSGGQWRMPPQGNTSTKGVERRPEVVISPTAANQPVALTLVPAVLMSDGSVFANFGLGFERVLRSCNGSSFVVVQPGQPQVVGSNGVVLSGMAQPTYTQPVPAPLTPSQQMLQSNAIRASTAAQMACFSRDASGRVFVIR